MGELLSVIKRRLPKPIPMGMFYPELCEEEISAFERQFEVSLPGGYRRFLMELGNGGEGPPAGGIEPLRTGPERPNAAELDGREQSPLMALPFPFTQPWIWDAGTVSDEGSREQADHGSLYLGTDGGGQEWRLIVTGPQRGQIWWFCTGGIQPLNPGRNFIQWYLQWLDGVDDWWTGMDPSAL